MVFAVLIFIYLKLELETLIGPLYSIASALDNFGYC